MSAPKWTGRKRNWSIEERIEINKLARSGLTCVEIGERFACTEGTIRSMTKVVSRRRGET